MQFTLTIELGNDELLTGDRRELIAKALSRVASDMRYDRIYKRGIELGRTGEIEVLEKVGSWQVRETPKEGSGRFTDCGRPTGSPYEGQD